MASDLEPIRGQTTVFCFFYGIKPWYVPYLRYFAMRA